MNKPLALSLILAFGAPAAAEMTAPQLPYLDAAAVRAQIRQQAHQEIHASPAISPEMQFAEGTEVPGQNKGLLGGGIHIPAFEGKITVAGDASAAAGLDIKVRWACYKPEYLAPTGYKSCGVEYKGESLAKIGPGGKFSFPEIKVSGPLFGGFFPVTITLEKNGQRIQILGSYSDKGYFENPVPVAQIPADLRALNLMTLSGGGYPAMFRGAVIDGAAKAAQREAVYANDLGCSVTVQEHNNGYTLFVQDGPRQAFLGMLKDFSGGDIGSFCKPAAASLKVGEITLSCGEQHNGGLPTRGLAVVSLAKADGSIKAVRVRGEVKKALGWITDTDINCEGLLRIR